MRLAHLNALLLHTCGESFDAFADLPKSMAFFKALGFSHNPQFTDDTGACIVVSETVLVMLLTHARFHDFTPKAICDTSKAVEVLLTLSCESRATAANAFSSSRPSSRASTSPIERSSKSTMKRFSSPSPTE